MQVGLVSWSNHGQIMDPIAGPVMIKIGPFVSIGHPLCMNGCYIATEHRLVARNNFRLVAPNNFTSDSRRFNC